VGGVVLVEHMERKRLLRRVLVMLSIACAIVIALARLHSARHDAKPGPAADARSAPVQLARTSRRLSISEHASLAGTIRDDAGQPLADAHVCAALDSLDSLDSLPRDPVCTASDDHGGYMLTDLPPGKYGVAAHAPHHVSAPYLPAGPDQPVEFLLAAREHRIAVDITLARGGAELHGTVTDVSGGAVPHALVSLYHSAGKRGWATVTTETDDDGHYAAWVAPTSIKATASAAGYVSADATADAPGTIDLVLAPESTVSGKVIDPVSGQPVADVTVYTDDTETNFPTGNWTISDDRGAFTIAKLKPGRYTVEARAPHGFGRTASVELPLAAHVTGVTVQLYPAYQLVGRVVDQSGAPCDALLWMSDDRKNIVLGAHDAHDGTQQIDGVLPGTYIANASCPDLIPATSTVIVTDRDVTATWTLTPGLSLSGRVVTASGTPVAGADISVVQTDQPPRQLGTNPSDHTAADGSYKLAGLQPGHYQLTTSRGMTASQYGARQTKLELDVHTAVQRDVVIPELGGTIVGTVTPPGPNVIVAFNDGPDGFNANAHPDSGGHYELHDIPPGNYKVVATVQGTRNNMQSEPVEVTVAADRTLTHDVALPGAAGEIRGRVVDDHGAPVTDAIVGVAVERGSDPVIDEARGDDSAVLVTTDGRFTAGQLEPMHYTVSARRPGGSETHVEHVRYGSDITIVLPAAGAIACVVHGAPGDDLMVTLVDGVSNRVVRSERPYHTGGAFDLEGVSPGSYKLVVASDDAQQLAPVTVVAGQTAHVELELQPRVTLVGRMIDARTHQPVAGVWLNVSATATAISSTSPSDSRNESDQDGRFELPFVPRGEVDLSGGNASPTIDVQVPAVHRTITASDPDVVDVGDIPVVVTAHGSKNGRDGMMVEATGGVARVTMVFDAAEHAGIAVGDVILAIDGISVQGDAATMASALLTGTAGDELDVELERGPVKLVLEP
jgi:protocatechuate 3,4-dioxygenase beta subunit